MTDTSVARPSYKEPWAHRLRMFLGVDVIFNFGAKTLGHVSTCYD